MILKIIFRIQGVILIISGLAPIIALETWLQMNRMGDINQLVVGMSLDSLPVLGRGFGIMLIAMGVVVFLIPNWVGNNLRGPAYSGGTDQYRFRVEYRIRHQRRAYWRREHDSEPHVSYHLCHYIFRSGSTAPE